MQTFTLTHRFQRVLRGFRLLPLAWLNRRRLLLLKQRQTINQKLPTPFHLPYPMSTERISLQLPYIIMSSLRTKISNKFAGTIWTTGTLNGRIVCLFRKLCLVYCGMTMVPNPIITSRKLHVSTKINGCRVSFCKFKSLPNG